MQNIGLYSQLGKEIDNFFKPFTSHLTKPQQGNLKEMTRGLIEGENCHLLQIGKKVSSEITPRKNTERYSRTLQKMDHQALHLQNILNSQQHFCRERETGEPVLIIPDGGDIQKPHAQKMENLCSPVDGSNGHNPGKGFPIISLMAYGTQSKEKRVLVSDLYSTESQDFVSAWSQQKQWMDALTPFTASLNTLVVEDAIADDNKRLTYYRNDLDSSFLVRLTTKRNFLIKRHPEDTDYESVSVKNLAQDLKSMTGTPRRYWNKKLNQKLTSSITWKAVEHPGIVDKKNQRIPLYLILVFTEGFSAPMLLLTDCNPKNAAGAWKYFFWYKRRWEIEKYYREIKQNFRLEQTLLQSYDALKSLLTWVMLVQTLLKKLARKASLFFQELSDLYLEYLKKLQIKVDQDDPPVSAFLNFIREILTQYQPLISHHFYRWKVFLSRYKTDLDQLLLIDFRRKW